MYTYCLFCETGKGSFVAHAVKQVYSCYAYSPLQIQHTWDKGQFVDRERLLLPGYVFVCSEEEIFQPQDIRRRLDRIIRCLRDTDRDYRLHGADEQFALMIHRKNGIIGKTEVTETDGRFTVTDPSFEGIPVEIQKVERRNQRMKIEMLIAGNKVQTWVEYEIVRTDQAPEKANNEQTGATDAQNEKTVTM